MFGSFFSSLKEKTVNDASVSSKRRYSRRLCDQCVAELNGQNYPVENWSFGGVLIGGDDRMFAIGQEHMFKLKFKLRNRILTIPQRGGVVRKSPSGIAFEFAPINQQTRNQLQTVVDDYVTNKFADSQA